MRFLTTLVVGLAVLIVAAAGLLAWGLFTQARGPNPLKSAAGAAIDLGLPEGCAIRSFAVAGQNIIIHVQGSGNGNSARPCDRILTVDPAQGRIVGTIESRGSPP